MEFAVLSLRQIEIAQNPGKAENRLTKKLAGTRHLSSIAFPSSVWEIMIDLTFDPTRRT
jgi:hypothetical protein